MTNRVTITGTLVDDPKIRSFEQSTPAACRRWLAASIAAPASARAAFRYWSCP